MSPKLITHNRDTSSPILDPPFQRQNVSLLWCFYSHNFKTKTKHKNVIPSENDPFVGHDASEFSVSIFNFESENKSGSYAKSWRVVTRLQAVVGVDIVAVVVVVLYDHNDRQNDIAKSDTNVEEEVHAV